MHLSEVETGREDEIEEVARHRIMGGLGDHGEEPGFYSECIGALGLYRAGE